MLIDNDDEEEFIALTQDFVRAKIRHVLSIFPKLSPSMLQVGIGTGIPPRFWKPIFKQMIAEGIVEVKQASFLTPNGRDQTYKIVSLVDTK